MKRFRNFSFGLFAVLAALPFVYAERPPGGGGAPRGGPAPRVEAPHVSENRGGGNVFRSSHGSIRHADTHIVQPQHVEAPHRVEQHQAEQHHVEQHQVEQHGHSIVHHDVEVDVNRSHFWHGFVHGARFHRLREGCFRFFIGGAPYFYDDGIFYQPVGDDFEEVYAPVGAVVPDLPDGAFEIDAGNTAYYYAGGAFYVQQADGFAVAPTLIGVNVPELPPGAVQVSYNGGVAYQFNGVYYLPNFVNGVIQYTTFMP